jgi:hypothetical protein
MKQQWLSKGNITKTKSSEHKMLHFLYICTMKYSGSQRNFKNEIEKMKYTGVMYTGSERMMGGEKVCIV